MSATPHALRQACATYLPQGTLDACVAQDECQQAGGRGRRRARARNWRSCAPSWSQKNIVTLPSDEQAQVAEAPPYNRANGAYINIPGPYDKDVAYVYNIAPPDPAWSAQERAAYIPGQANLLYTSVHEVWPGHFQQFLHSNRNPSKIAALWVGYAYAEGWAHYSEEMMWEEGLGNGDAEQHIGQLVECAAARRALPVGDRAAHAGNDQSPQSDRMFRERAFLDPGNARQQAARGTYDPEYLKYTLGKLMIRKLRADWVARQPGAAGAAPMQYWHEFHDRFMAFTGPIPLIRQALLGRGGPALLVPHRRFQEAERAGVGIEAHAHPEGDRLVVLAVADGKARRTRQARREREFPHAPRRPSTGRPSPRTP